MSQPPLFTPVDIMLDGKYIHSLFIPVTTADSIAANGLPVYDINRIKQYIEHKLPSLRNKPYTIHF